MTDPWREFDQHVAKLAGSAWAWIILGSVILIWLVLGLIFHFSGRWMLLVTTGTSVVTLLMVFLVLKTRNRRTKAIALKLDQLQCAINRQYRRHHNGKT